MLDLCHSSFKLYRFWLYWRTEKTTSVLDTGLKYCWGYAYYRDANMVGKGKGIQPEVFSCFACYTIQFVARRFSLNCAITDVILWSDSKIIFNIFKTCSKIVRSDVIHIIFSLPTLSITRQECWLNVFK